jgi:hypothetical protein
MADSGETADLFADIMSDYAAEKDKGVKQPKLSDSHLERLRSLGDIRVKLGEVGLKPLSRTHGEITLIETSTAKGGRNG